MHSCLRFAAVTLFTFVALSLPILNDQLIGEQSAPTSRNAVLFQHDEPVAQPAAQTVSESRLSQGVRCGERSCHLHATCSPEFHCICNDGFIGDGHWCGPVATNTVHAAEAITARSSLSSPFVNNRVEAVTTRPSTAAITERLKSSAITVVVLISNINNPDGSLLSHAVSALHTAVATDAISVQIIASDSVVVPPQLGVFTVVRAGPVATIPIAWSILSDGKKNPPEWTIILPIEWIQSNASALFFDTVKTAEGSDMVTLGVIMTGMNAVSSAAPVLFGKQSFDPAHQPHRGDGFVKIDAQSWTPFCSLSSPIIVSRGFLQAFASRGRVSSVFDRAGESQPGMADLDGCIAMGSSAKDFAGCLYEEFGMYCHSISTLASRSATESNEWTISRRHAQWNCSIEVPSGVDRNGLPETHTITAVCQQPFASHPPLVEVQKKMAISSEDTGKHYRETLAPEEAPNLDTRNDVTVTSKTGATNLSTSWVLFADDSSRGASDLPDPPKVL